LREDRVSFSGGSLAIEGPSGTRRLSLAQVKSIYECRMEDEAHQGDEPFHLLILETEFLLVGPFVPGGLGAVEALMAERPDVPVEHWLVRHVPHRFRERSRLGLRLFPVSGLRFGHLSELAHFRLQPLEESHAPR
jgi:hypothetical protein